MQEQTPERSATSDFLDHDPLHEAAMSELGMDSDELKDLFAQVDKDVIGWRPSPGDKIGGTVADITVGTSEYGEYPLITVETPSGKLVGIHCFHHVLKNEIERKLQQGRLNVGDMIAVSYRGEGDAKGGNNAPNMYRVAIRPAAIGA